VSTRNGVTRRGTSNSNDRGSSKDRFARKVWLLLTFSPKLGPDEAWCEFNCGTILTIETITVDRYPIPGCDGGKYVKGNIRPACAKCNSEHGGPLRKQAA
jgi:hypothetical protein